MNEGLISWNFPNVISIVLMGALVWSAMGLASHFVRSRSSNAKAA